MGDSKLNSAPSLQATHSHLSSCLRSLSGASSSAEAAAQATDQGARDNSGAQDVMEGSNGSTHEADSKENARLNHAEESGKREWGDAAHLFLASSLPTNIANAANYDEHSNFPIPSEVDEPNQIESTPGASDLDRSAGSGFTETETDGVRIVEKCNKEDLDLVEGALLHMLGGKVKPRESNDGKPSRADQQPLVLLEDQDIPHAEMEMVLLAKLLDQVHSLRMDKKLRKGRSGEIQTGATIQGGSRDRKPVKNELSKMVEAATQAALSAADAAKAAAASVAKNSEAIELLLQKLSPSLSSSITENLQYKGLPGRQRNKHNVNKDDDKNNVDEEEGSSEKKIVKQNRTTHWILGFMLVVTLVWRYGLVKVGRRFTDTVRNPLGSLGEMVSDGFSSGKDNEEDESNDEILKGNMLPQLKLPSVFQDNTDEERKVPAAETGEGNVFNFGNFWQVKPNAR